MLLQPNSTIISMTPLMLKGVFTRRFGSICASALGSFCISLWIYELRPLILVCKVHLCNCYREEKHRKKRSFFVANAGSTNDATSFALSACILCVGIFVRKGGVFQGDPPTKKNGANRNVSIFLYNTPISKICTEVVRYFQSTVPLT